MKSTLAHLQINVTHPETSLPFYKDLLTYFEYDIIDECSVHIGASNGGTDIWIIATDAAFKSTHYHRKQTGLNHIAFRVANEAAINQFQEEFLAPRGITPLYDTPKYFPEYSEGYYAIFFADPDKIKIEVMTK